MSSIEPIHVGSEIQANQIVLRCHVSLVKKKSNFTWRFLLLLRRISNVSPDLGFSRQPFDYRSPKSLLVTPNLWLPYSHLHFILSLSLCSNSLFEGGSISHQTEAKKKRGFPNYTFLTWRLVVLRTWW